MSRPLTASVLRAARSAARQTRSINTHATPGSRTAASGASHTRVAVAAAVLLATGAGAYALDKSELRAALPLIVDRYAIQCDAAPAPVDGDVKVDPATQVAHPLTLTPASTPALTLVGLGVRTVSFLSFKVYSAGFYVNDYVLRNSLHSLPGWSNFSATEITGPAGEGMIQALLDSPADVAVRIVPFRNTDFSHLRDGFTRTLLARQKIQRQQGLLTPADDERIATSLQALKAMFPTGSVPKGNELIVTRSRDGKFGLEYKGKVLGTVADKWLADNMVLAYFDAKNSISPPLRASVAEGLEEFYQKK
ncbi:uncharacterized protein EHS24_001811 [Apiotrichum porosum]|uniref:Chalcone isomerase domain-containing protein n=1 Tax=Apiotrichum porosum TaxID=105984 RepID=A0A427XJ92_9TREE|nr:uncharacterized protein EHS24_001811 [Apiotrichum porosum]RSH78888.1 hypothetical protein EHS24_001811 [Apiotrichum porosum]